MEKFISAQTKSDLLKIGLYQIVTGLLGLAIFLWSSLGTQRWTLLSVILMMMAVFIFAFSILTGFLCLKSNERALTLSLVNQGIQMVSFSIVGYGFRYAPSFFLSVGVDLTESFKFTFSAGLTDVAVKIGVQSDVIAIDFNVIAIIIFVWLDKLNKRMKSEQEIRMDTRFTERVQKGY